jgi:hypothetical protein
LGILTSSFLDTWTLHSFCCTNIYFVFLVLGLHA